LNPIRASKLLANKHVIQILSATFHEARSAQELSDTLDISIAACYRKIRELETLGLLKCTKKILSKDGKRIRLYQSQVKGAFIFFENGRLKVKFDLLDQKEEKEERVWNVIDVLKA